MSTSPVFVTSPRLLLVAGLIVLLGGCGGGSGSGDNTGIRGVIDIVAGSRVDGDYADLWWPSESWPDGSRGAVTLPVPATAAGYLSNVSGSYAIGLGFPQDTGDTYLIPLLSGDRFFLQCFPSTGNSEDSLNVSLALNGNQVFGGDACGTGGTITSSPAGESTLTITANDGGPFRYVLTIAPQGSLSAQNVSWPEPPLSVDEAIVSGPVAVATSMSSSGLRASSVMTMERSIGPDTWQVSRAPVVSALSGQPSSHDPRAATIDWIRGMREEFGLNIEPNYLFRKGTFSPGTNSSYNSNNWNLVQINMPEAWGLTGSNWGQGIGVAVMDTGMFSTSPDTYDEWHEDLSDNIVSPGGILDFVSGDFDVDGHPGRDGVPGTPITPGNPTRTSFHGTHVAGIIAAVDNNIGTVGVAHGATILPYRVMGVSPITGEDGTGAASDLIAAINDAADRNDVNVINLSLGGLPQIDALQRATDRAYESGILTVAAAGNTPDASAEYPAANRRVIGVGASNRSGSLASYSNYGQSLDLLAPGGEPNDAILNAYGTVSSGNLLSSNYAFLAGTSMAAPHVTGVYALMKSTADVSPGQFRAQLIAGYLTNKAAPLDNYALFGEGLLDAEKALNITTRSEFPTVVSAWPRVVDLNPAGNESRVLLEVLKPAAAQEPLVSGAPEFPAWLEVTDGAGNPLATGNRFPDDVRIRVDSDAVLSGRSLSDEIRIPYSNDSGSDRHLVIPVYVQALDPVEERDAGEHYVLLIDANDYDSFLVVKASYRNGQYLFAINNVAPGDYILVAGTDLDNNGFICENGEACAEYPRTGFRQVITVREGQVTNVKMTTSFRRPGIAEMGLPRYGFEGYRRLEASLDEGEPRRRLP